MRGKIIKSVFSKSGNFMFAFVILLVLASLTACNKQEKEEVKPIIAVSIVPEATFVDAVTKGAFDIVTMIPPGMSPENYEPTPLLMEEFYKADIYFAIGVPTEEANIFPIVSDNTKIIKLQEEVSTQYPERFFASGERDPHIWLSPKRVVVMINTICSEVCLLDEKNAEIYKENAREYIKELDDVNSKIEEALEGTTYKSFFVYHPAFGYLADDYGLTMYALEENGKEAQISHLQEMIDLAKEKKCKVLFYQEEIDSSQAAAFAEEIGGVSIALSPLSPDYIENMKYMAKTIAQYME